MIKEAIESGLILVIIVISAIFINFNVFLRGGLPSLAEFFVSIAYVVTWVLIFKLALKKEKYNLIFLSTVFWLLTCVTSITAFYIIISNEIMSFFIPFVIVFITPIYGLELLFNHKYMILIFISIISCCFSYFGVKFLITQRKSR